MFRDDNKSIGMRPWPWPLFIVRTRLIIRVIRTTMFEPVGDGTIRSACRSLKRDYQFVQFINSMNNL